jgi:thioesterase domain-containing protein
VLSLAPDSPVILGGYCWGGLAAWHLAHLLRSRGVEVLELLLVDTLSLNARPLLRGLAKLFDTAGAIVPGRAGRFLRQHLESVHSPQPNGAIMKNGFYWMVPRYVPPGTDVDVTCFIADKANHFNIDPNPWRKLARTVNAVSVPGTHESMLVAERESLAKALTAALDA